MFYPRLEHEKWLSEEFLRSKAYFSLFQALLTNTSRVFDGDMTLYGAIHFASDAHMGQYREDGSPYIDHPLAVLRLLWQCSMDLPIEAYLAAILHDVLEDTSVTYEDVLAVAGAHVAAMVRALTKDDAYYALPSNTREYLYLSHIKKISLVYPSILLIKIMDRLHNIQTAQALPLGRRQRLLLETQEIYIPFFEGCLQGTPHPYDRLYHQSLQKLSRSAVLIPASPSTHTPPC